LNGVTAVILGFLAEIGTSGANYLKVLERPNLHHFRHMTDSWLLASMVHSVSGWRQGVQVRLRSLENACHTWALWRTYSRRGAIQIHVYLTLLYVTNFCCRQGLLSTHSFLVNS